MRKQEEEKGEPKPQGTPRQHKLLPKIPRTMSEFSSSQHNSTSEDETGSQPLPPSEHLLLIEREVDEINSLPQSLDREKEPTIFARPPILLRQKLRLLWRNGCLKSYLMKRLREKKITELTDQYYKASKQDYDRMVGDKNQFVNELMFLEWKLASSKLRRLQNEEGQMRKVIEELRQKISKEEEPKERQRLEMEFVKVVKSRDQLNLGELAKEEHQKWQQFDEQIQEMAKVYTPESLGIDTSKTLAKAQEQKDNFLKQVRDKEEYMQPIVELTQMRTKLEMELTHQIQRIAAVLKERDKNIDSYDAKIEEEINQLLKEMREKKSKDNVEQPLRQQLMALKQLKVEKAGLLIAINEVNQQIKRSNERRVTDKHKFEKHMQHLRKQLREAEDNLAENQNNYAKRSMELRSLIMKFELEQYMQRLRLILSGLRYSKADLLEKIDLKEAAIREKCFANTRLVSEEGLEQELKQRELILSNSVQDCCKMQMKIKKMEGSEQLTRRRLRTLQEEISACAEVFKNNIIHGSRFPIWSPTPHQSRIFESRIKDMMKVPGNTILKIIGELIKELITEDIKDHTDQCDEFQAKLKEIFGPTINEGFKPKLLLEKYKSLRTLHNKALIQIEGIIELIRADGKQYSTFQTMRSIYENFLQQEAKLEEALVSLCKSTAE